MLDRMKFSKSSFWLGVNSPNCTAQYRNVIEPKENSSGIAESRMILAGIFSRQKRRSVVNMFSTADPFVRASLAT
jgi:hypothetical protein